MKASLALAILILIAGTVLCWQDTQRLAMARKLHDRRTTGIPAESLADRENSTRASRPRRDPAVRARFVLDGYNAFMRDYQKISEGGGNPEIAAEIHNRYRELMEQIGCLNADELKILIAESRAIQQINGSPLSQLFISEIAKDRPALALGFLSEEADQGPDSLMGDRNFIESSIGTWSKEDPAAALAWVLKCKDKFPINAIVRVNRELIRGAAIRDPQSAFRLLGEMDEDEVQHGIDSIIDECGTPEQLSAALTGLPEYLKTLEDEKKKAVIKGQVMTWLAYSAAKTGFESGTRWIESANLSAAEIEGFSINLGGNSSHFREEDVIKWAEWISEHSANAGNDRSMRDFIAGWARNDYRAAGDWIMAAADSPAKNSSIRAYAELVSEYEPETAAQWAETSPKGPEQDATLQKIHKNWSKKDAEAAAIFAQKYGIKSNSAGIRR